MTADQEPRSPTARLLGVGAKGAERLAGATGVDKAVEDAVEEAMLASQKAQMLVERIAEAPEVRAAITEQGVGLVTDLGRRLTAVTERLDDALERLAHRLLRRPEHEETDEVGLVTRVVAAGLDVALGSVLFSIASGLFASVFPFTFGGDSLSPVGVGVLVALGVLAGGAILTAFWALVGQTPGMRLLSIHLEVDGSSHVGLRRALRRILARRWPRCPPGWASWRSCSRARDRAGTTISPAPRWSTTPPATRRRGRGWTRAARLGLDRGVHLDELGLSGLDPELAQDRHQPLAMGGEVLLRVPDLAHAQVVGGAEGHVELEAVRRGPRPGLLELADALVVLLRRERGRCKADQDAHATSRAWKMRIGRP